VKPLLTQALELLLGPDVVSIRAKEDLAGLDRAGLPPIVSLSPSHELSKVLRHKGYTHFRRFVSLPSRDAVRWLLPIGNAGGTVEGTQIYVPHRWLPRAAKELFIAAIKMGWNGALLPQVVIASTEPLRLETLVSSVTGVNAPLFALSFGRRPAVRKLTVQAMHPEGGVLGYMKLPLTECAMERVCHEASVLERLWGYPALHPHIPRLLYAGAWNGSYMLFQSPLSGEIGPVNITAAHTEFLETLWNANPVARSGQSLVEEVGRKWDNRMASLGSAWDDLGQEVLRRAALGLNGETVRCGISHGDFAPWNTRVQQGALLLFDWESAQWEAPVLWDLFHFSLQAAVSLAKKNRSRFPDDRTAKSSYLLYLLSSLMQFAEEDNWAGVDHRKKILLDALQETACVQTEERNLMTHTVRSILSANTHKH